MRVAVDVLGVEAHDVEQLTHVVHALGLVAHRAVDDERLGDDLADGHARVQARVGVLEDELHVMAHALELALVHVSHVLALEHHLAVRGVREAHDAAARRGLAAARLAHEAEGLAGIDVEADVVDGLDGLLVPAGKDAGVDVELLGEVLDVKQWLCHYASPPFESVAAAWAAAAAAAAFAARVREFSGAFLRTNSSSIEKWQRE